LFDLAQVAWRVLLATEPRSDLGVHNGKKRFMRFSSMAGISDILGILPPSGRFLAIECKRPGNKPTAEQDAFLDIVRQCGGIAVCVRSIDELEQALTDAGVWPLLGSRLAS